MREFMLYIRNDGTDLPPQREEEFLRACEAHIEDLRRLGKLISAQPLGSEGKIVSRTSGGWLEQPYHISRPVNAGYYHIRADNLEDAIAIAQRNPEFTYRPSANIEVRSIKTGEETTGYTYPSELPPAG